MNNGKICEEKLKLFSNITGLLTKEKRLWPHYMASL